jgi:hypothetical protein
MKEKVELGQWSDYQRRKRCLGFVLYIYSGTVTCLCYSDVILTRVPN